LKKNKNVPMKNKTCVVIPAFNEEKSISKVLDGLLQNGWRNIVVVNDGSRDKTSKIVKRYKDVHLVEHAINRGLGGALGTGLQAACKLGHDVIVTFDADGQHDVRNLSAVVKPIHKGECEVVIGSRLINPKGMPWYRRLMNRFANIVTYTLFQIWTTDSQSGFRAFSLNAAHKLDLQTNKMEVSSEILHKIHANKLKFKEIPIKAIYTDYSLSKGQNFFEGVKTLIKLLIYKVI
jgi:UDP-N-acetylglucosamine---dolichyl-phosphate N-acetylglucosaminyltransferase